MGLREVGALLWWGSLKEGGHREDIDVDKIKRLKLIFKKHHGRVWNVFIRLSFGTSGRLFYMRKKKTLALYQASYFSTKEA
jgi:phosphopantetheinyl transferase (holo-ACP synthase)